MPLHKTRRDLANDRRGVTALEYGIIAAAVAAAIVVSATQVGSSLGNLILNVTSSL